MALSCALLQAQSPEFGYIGYAKPELVASRRVIWSIDVVQRGGGNGLSLTTYRIYESYGFVLLFLSFLPPFLFFLRHVWIP
jgi:hypothetical protein